MTNKEAVAANRPTRPASLPAAGRPKPKSRRVVRWLAVSCAVTLLALMTWTSVRRVAGQEGTAERGAPRLGLFSEPPEIRSVDGVLNATLTAEIKQIEVAGRQVTARVYNGLYVPPTLRVKPGDVIKLKLVNKIDMMTNIHTHGLNVSPSGNSDNVFVHVEPSPSEPNAFDYEITIPAGHPAGLFYYHPHAHGNTELQTFSGMSGLLIVEGILDPFPALRGIRERVMALKDIQIQPDGTVPDDIDSGAPTNRTINGLTEPLIDIRPGETQLWRVGNIGADIFYRLKLDGHVLYEVARDGNRHNRLIPKNEIDVPPSSRVEFLVQGGFWGRYQFRTLALNTGPQGDDYPEVTLATLASVGWWHWPANLNRLRFPPVEDLRTKPIANRRTFVFSETADGNTFFVNCREFDMDRVDTQVRLGDVEEWTILNVSEELHVFHIHQLDFQVTEVNGVEQEFVGRQDTVTTPVTNDPATNVPCPQLPAPGAGQVKVLIPFTNPVILGKFVYHCHIMAHEDNGMMAVIEVLPPSGQATEGSAGNSAEPGHHKHH